MGRGREKVENCRGEAHQSQHAQVCRCASGVIFICVQYCAACRFYGWKCFMVKDGDVPVHTLEHFQQITKTQMIVRDSLPDSYLPLAAAAEYHAQQLRPKIEEAIFIEHQGIK